MKKSLLIIAVGVGIGYVLGTRAGRERYDQIVARVTGIWEDPRVAKARAEAAQYAREQAPVIRDRAQEAATTAAKAAAKKVTETVENVSSRVRSATSDAATTDTRS